MADVQAFVVCREILPRDGEVDLIGIAGRLLLQNTPSRVAFRAAAILVDLAPDVEYEVKLDCFYNSEDPFSGFHSEKIQQSKDNETTLITFTTDEFLVPGYGRIDFKLRVGSECTRRYTLFVEKGSENDGDGRQ